jgi:predicted O-methyltransferase YrrM
MKNDSWLPSQKLAIKNFNKYLSNFIDKPNLNFLQIGVYVGTSSEWLLKNILTNNSSKLYDVDIWDEKNKRWGGENEETVYDQNIKKYTNVIKNKMLSNDFFKINTLFFDFIYIDGGIEKDETYKDIENSFNFLKNNGLIIVDDYEYAGEYKKNIIDYPPVRQYDVDRFILKNKEKIYNKISNGQIILKKINNV